MTGRACCCLAEKPELGPPCGLTNPIGERLTGALACTGIGFYAFDDERRCVAGPTANLSQPRAFGVVDESQRIVHIVELYDHYPVGSPVALDETGCPAPYQEAASVDQDALGDLRGVGVEAVLVGNLVVNDDDFRGLPLFFGHDARLVSPAHPVYAKAILPSAR